MKLKSPYLVRPGSKLKLAGMHTKTHHGVKDEVDAKLLTAKHRQKLEDLQEKLYATQENSVLIVLQGLDTAGKDGTIRHIFSGINPQGCQVASFKVPTTLEARHDFLWRCHQQVPPRGVIGIFNRSHYEDVLSPRVHGNIDATTVQQRYEAINDWEKMLADNGTLILKFFLHISRKEQTDRLQARIDTPEKRWKLSAADFQERIYWDDYQKAYQDILRHTSKKHAPWFVIPADHKWFRDVAISGILVDAIESLKLQMPSPEFNAEGIDLKKQNPQKVAQEVRHRADEAKSRK